MKRRFLPFLSLRSTDPRALVLAAAGTALCLSLIQTLAVAWASLSFAVLFALACGPEWRILLKRLALANFFILFIWLTVPWTMPGTAILTLGPFALSREGVMLATGVSVKCNAIVLIYIAIMADMDLARIGVALEQLYMPEKLVFLFLFTCRYIHVIGDEWKKLQTAAALRGFILKSSLHTYRTIANMLGLTVINSVNRSHRIYEAMLLRGFSGHFHTAAELKAGTCDIVFTTFFFLVLACLLGADIYIRYWYV